ncbi:MAG: tRNA (guanosine(46)-N7)-methyltransferase TrmB [Terrimicrobiaceae bacterium]|nr:tRNA (guanosine(46)-N7)-methyltransferase TrmB [Terrimicrobiaceae bacterium]
MNAALDAPGPADPPLEWLRSGEPLEIDLGCHKGTFVVAMARQFPCVRFLGIERQRGRVEKSRAKIERLALANARVVPGEGLETLRDLLPDGVARVVHVSFPDPWPKRRHQARRLVNRAFLDEAWRVIEPGGTLRVMTDDAPYFAAMIGVAAGFPGFREADWEDGRIYPETEFQRKFAALAKPIYRLALRRCDSMSSE